MKRQMSKQPTGKGRPLNLRDFPEDLYWKCKVPAAENRMTLTKFVAPGLRRAVSEADGKS